MLEAFRSLPSLLPGDSVGGGWFLVRTLLPPERRGKKGLDNWAIIHPQKEQEAASASAGAGSQPARPSFSPPPLSMASRVWFLVQIALEKQEGGGPCPVSSDQRVGRVSGPGVAGMYISWVSAANWVLVTNLWGPEV